MHRLGKGKIFVKEDIPGLSTGNARGSAGKVSKKIKNKLPARRFAPGGGLPPAAKSFEIFAWFGR
jgi:hypothetical protein